MAYFEKRGNKWRAQVRIKGARPRYATFATKAAAEAWAAEIEDSEKFLALTGKTRAPVGMTVADLFNLWIEEVSEGRTSAAWEINKLKAWALDDLGRTKLEALTVEVFEKLKLARLREVKATTAAREFGFMSGVFTWAHTIKKIIPVHPMKGVKWPKIPRKSRSRRVSERELIEVCRLLGFDRVSTPTKSRHRVAWAWEFSIETALRGGEILALEWRDIDFARRVLLVRAEDKRAAKTQATRREVPLSPRAVQMLLIAKGNDQIERDKKVLPIGHGNKDKINSEILRPELEKAGIFDLNMHDCRHEAITRMARSGVMPPDLMRIVGHSALEETMRYYEFSADQIAAKMHGEETSEPNVFQQSATVEPVAVEVEPPSRDEILAALRKMNTNDLAALLSGLGK